MHPSQLGPSRAASNMGYALPGLEDLQLQEERVFEVHQTLHLNTTFT